MTEAPSIPPQLSPDIKTSEETMRGLAEEELGSLVQEEVDLDAQIEAKKLSIEQKRVSGENIDTDTEILEALEEKRGDIAVALELSAQKHGYDLSTEMGDNTHNVLIDGVLKKQKKERGVSMVSGIERDTISHMTLEKPPTTTEKLRELNQITKEEPRGVIEASLSTLRQQLKDLQENMGKGNFSSKEDGGKEGDEILAKSLEEDITRTEKRLSGEDGAKTDGSDMSYRPPENARRPEETPVNSTTEHQDQTVVGDNKELAPETVYSGTNAKSLREEIVRLNLERSKIINNTRYRKPTEEERGALNDITGRMVTLKDKLSSFPPEEQAVTVSDTEIESDATRKTEAPAVAESVVFVQEKTAVATETPGQQPHVEGFSPENALEQTKKEIDTLKQKKEEILKNIRDHTVITDHVKEAIGVNKRIEELENTLRNPAKLNQQEINNARDVETPSVEAHLNTGVNTTTPDSATHTKATGEIIPNLFEKSITRIRSEDPARAERLLATIGASPEQKERIEKLLGATETQTQKVEQDIEKLKAKDPRVVEQLLKIGEWYRTVPLKKKLIASAFLIGGASFLAASGGAGAAMIATAALTGSGFQRFLGGLAVAATVEGVLTKQSLARNEEEKKIMGVRMNVILGALAGSGVFLGGKLLGDYLSTHSGGETGSGADEKITGQVKVPPATPEHIPRVETQNMYEAAQKEIHQAIPLPHEAAAETANSIMTPNNEIISHAANKIVEADYLVHGGDNLWNIIKEKIPEIQGLDGEGRQSNAIANIIEQIKKDPESFGITSGNVDTLSAGDTIDLEKVRGVLDTTKISVDGHETSIIERANELTDIETSHIMENNAKISAWHTAHPDTLLTTETVDKILSGHDVSTTTGVEHSSTIDTAEKYANVRKDMESIEATSMKTTEILRADVQTMFGSKGFFGYGFLGTNGERSIDWLDLKGRTVDEVLSKKFVGVPTGEEGAVQKFGIDSFSAVDKMREYIYMLVEKAGAGTIPEPNESVEHFSKRAINVIISKK